MIIIIIIISTIHCRFSPRGRLPRTGPGLDHRQRQGCAAGLQKGAGLDFSVAGATEDATLVLR